jgi:TrmH family RNA methyltransferase
MLAKGGYEIETILFALTFVVRSPKLSKSAINRNQYCNFSKLAYRDTTEGILAVAKTKSMQLSNLKLSENPF